jgi:hypothetical protein
MNIVCNVDLALLVIASELLIHQTKLFLEGIVDGVVWKRVWTEMMCTTE